jgi:hypothetical protein
MPAIGGAATPLKAKGGRDLGANRGQGPLLQVDQ